MLAFVLLNSGAMLAALAVAANLLPGRGRGLALGAVTGFLIVVHASVLFAGLLGHLTAAGLAALGGAVAFAAVCVALAVARAMPAPVHAPPPSDWAARFTTASLFAPLAAIAAGAAWAWPHLFGGTRLWVWDDYTYHMVYPALWLREQAIAAVAPAHAFTMQAWYPLSASVVATWFMVPLASVRDEALAWVSLTGVLYAGIIAAGAGTLCGRVGCRPGAWAVPVVLFATSHRTAIMAAGFSDADLAQAASLFGALAFAVPRGEAESARDVRIDGWYAGLLTGIALGMKVSAAAPALVVLLAMALRARACGTRVDERVRAVAAIGLIFAASWVATAGYWYARNVFHTGNPVYPAAFLGWPGTTFPETTLLEYAHRYGVRRAAADAFGIYMNWPRFHASVAIAGLVGLAAWLIARRRWLTRAQRFFAYTAVAVTAAVLLPLPAAPYSAGNALTFRAGFVHWDSMRYVAILFFLGWAALGILVDGGAGASRGRALAAAVIAAVGVVTSGLPWVVLPGVAAAAVLCALARLSPFPTSAARPRLFAAGVAVVAALMALIVWWHGAKAAASRAAFYAEPLFGAAAAVLDRQPAGTRVAVFGDQWVYPAFGDQLHLHPVRLDRDGEVATRPIGGAMEPGDCTVAPAVFRSKLDASGVSLVVVVRQPHPGRSSSLPSQHSALQAAGDADLLYQDLSVAIWRLRGQRPALSPSAAPSDGASRGRYLTPDGSPRPGRALEQARARPERDCVTIGPLAFRCRPRSERSTP